MARKNQKLINYHGSSDLPENLLSNLDLGEIAVKHSTGGTAQLVIKTGDNNSATTMATFVESAGVVNMISQGVANVTTNVTELAKSLSAVSATAVSTQSALTEHMISNGEFHNEVRNNLSATVMSDIENLATNYYDKEAVNGLLDTITGNTGNLQTSLSNIASSVSAFSASVVNNYTTHTEASGIRDTAITSAAGYTNEVSGNIASTLLTGYWTSATTQEKLNTITGNTSQTQTDLSTLTGSVDAIEPKANAALNAFNLGTVSDASSTQSGAKAAYTAGGAATLDLSSLVIDCGDW